MTAWNIRPIASALWRNRTGALLVAFQIAIGLAVLVNAVYVVKQRVEKIGRPTGMDTANMIWVASAGFARTSTTRRAGARTSRRCAACRASRRRACLSNIPLSGGGSSNGFQNRPGEIRHQGNGAGQQLRRGRAGDRGARRQADCGTAFEAQRDPAADSETFDMSPQAIVTQAFAKDLFPDDPNPLGKTFYDGLSKPIVDRRDHRAHAGRLGRLGQARPRRVVPAHEERAVVGLPRPDRARPPRCRDARHRGEARRLEPRTPAALGPAIRLLHRPVLPRRPQHGDLPGERDECTACDHCARHLRPRDLQRQHAHPPDRHAARGRRAALRHRPPLPGRELDGDDGGHRRRLRRSRSASATGYRSSTNCRGWTSITWSAACSPSG